jgi:adenine phosphoribosyltransferase
MMDLRKYLTVVEDFPKPGVRFYDITPLLADKAAFTHTIYEFGRYITIPTQKIVGIESRGLILGAPLAYQKVCGFVPLRKSGKLPCAAHTIAYDLEYGQAELQIPCDVIGPGDSVVIVDDVLATGNSAKAGYDLVGSVGGPVTQFLFLAEICGLDGRNVLEEYCPDTRITALLKLFPNDVNNAGRTSNCGKDEPP